MASSNKIRGITIEIGGDTSGLQSALKNVNSEINTTQKTLKDVERLLKIDPTNIELLNQKQRLLNQSTEEYNTKLKALKNAQEQFAEAAASGDKKAQASYDALQREIVSVQDYLKKAQKSSEDFNASLAQVSAGLNKVGEVADKVAEKTKALSAIGAAVAGSLAAMGVKAMTTADDLNTLAQQSGFSTEELQKFQYASELVDVSSDTIIGAVRKLKKNMASESADITDAFNQLGISISDAGGMKDATVVFYDVLSALSQVRNETERDQIAMKLFGKSADELAGIIDDGGAALKAYGDQAKIWSQESIDAANQVNDEIEKLKSDFEQAVLISGAKILEELEPVIQDVISGITSLLDFLSSLDGDTLALIGTIGLAVAAISPLAALISDVTIAAAGLIAVLPALTAAAPWIALGIAIADLVYQIVDNWDELKEAFINGWNTIKEKVIQPFIDAWERVKDYFITLWDTITERVKTNINTMIGWINTAIDKINDFTSAINNSALGELLGINIGQIGNIKMLAGGGTVKNGESAIVGEVAPEILTVRNGQANVQPITNNYSNVYNQMTDRPVELNIDLDGMTVARQIYNPMQRVGALAGGSCIK